MGHIDYSGTRGMVSVPDEWLATASTVSTHANGVAKRTDISVVTMPGAGMGAPACFIPARAELQVDTDVCLPGVKPETVDVNDELWRLSHPAFYGAMAHECAHAAHTRFDPKVLTADHGATPKIIDVIVLLEEPRIEHKLLAEKSAFRPYLHATAMDIIVKDFTLADTKYGAAAAAALLLARVDGGTLKAADVSAFVGPIQDVLGATLLETLGNLWRRFLASGDEDHAEQVQIAREWLEALGEDPDDDSTEGLAAGGLTEGEDGEGEGDGSGEGDGEGEGGSLSKAIAKAAAIAATEADEAMVEKRSGERGKRMREARKAAAERAASGEKEREAAFGAHGYSPEGWFHFAGSRPPTSEERAAAVRLAKVLEKVDYRDRAVTKIASDVPPGRLRTRAAVAATSALDRGAPMDPHLFTGKRRKVVDSPPLTVGLMLDVSGSMSSATRPMASTQWVLSTAGQHIDAHVASVHFGVAAYGVAPVGMKMPQVMEYNAYDGHETPREGFLALDRELRLLDGDGARLLVIASDAYFVHAPQQRYAEKIMGMCRSHGVAVLWLDFTGGIHSTYGYGTVLVTGGKSPAEVAEIVGRAAVEELRRVSQRR